MSRKLEIIPNLERVMKERYYQEGETTIQDVIRRVADFVAEGEFKYAWKREQIKALADKYFETMNARLWLPSSPFLMNAGTAQPMLFACFVVGGLEDNRKAIYETLERQGEINALGGGTGFNFSKLREEGSPIKSTGGTSSGVMSFMDLFNQNGEIIKQGGRRRSANIGILRYNHPEIMKFINYKNDHDKLQNFNISVLVDAEFMRKVKTKEDYDIISPKGNVVVGTLNAYEVFMNIMENNWKSAEPALLFMDNINELNPMKSYLGYIVTTNPCGEVVLYENEACDLASLNLEEFVGWDGKVDWIKLREVVHLVIRFLDTAIDVNMYPDEKIEKMVKSLRRLGLGIMGLHGALIKAGYEYSSPEGRVFANDLMRFIYTESWNASQDLANEKGAFPLWEHSEYKEESFFVRNVACTTIAPTGTISQIVNCSSSGCEPIFAVAESREILNADNQKEVKFRINPFFKEYAEHFGFWTEDLPKLINDNGGKVTGIMQVPLVAQMLFETAMEISALDHVRMQGALQEYVDNSISKTINMPNSATVEEIAEAYMLGNSLGLKGMTIYRDGSRDSQVLYAGKKEEPKPEHEVTGVPELSRGFIKKAPQESDDSKTVRIDTGCGTMYLDMTKDFDGDIDQTFVMRGSSGTCLSNQNAVSRLISLALRGGISIDDVIDQLQSIPACPAYVGKRKAGGYVSAGSSCPTAIAFKLKEFTQRRPIAKLFATGEIDKIEDIETQCTSCATCSACSIEPNVVGKLMPVNPEKVNGMLGSEKFKRIARLEAEQLVELGYSDKCPDCGANMKPDSGCKTCSFCGYSKCD